MPKLMKKYRAKESAIRNVIARFRKKNNLTRTNGMYNAPTKITLATFGGGKWED